MSVGDMAKAARLERLINANTCAATACPYRHVPSLAPGSRAPSVRRALEVRRAFLNRTDGCWKMLRGGTYTLPDYTDADKTQADNWLHRVGMLHKSTYGKGYMPLHVAERPIVREWQQL
jgi:hypothetical protein